MTTKQREEQRQARFPLIVKRAGTSVRIYRVVRPDSPPYYQVADYSTGKRRLRSFTDLGDAKAAALEIAERTSRGEIDVLRMTPADRASFVRACQLLRPTRTAIEVAASAFAQAFEILGSDHVVDAARFYAARHKQSQAKPVAAAVEELLSVKEARGASPRYLQDLRFRLGRFAQAFAMNCADVSTAKLQSWFDGQTLAPQSYKNFRTAMHTFFEFAVARGYAADNPVEGVERVKVRTAPAPPYTALELAKLLAAARPEFVPCVALSAFGGLRSAEVERLEWTDIDLAGRCIVIGATKAKTASRRIVPIHDALAAWLAPYAGQTGPVWKGTHDAFYDAQQSTAKAAGVRWKPNALRHGYASARFALTGDAGRVAGELGNSAAVVHRHYRELMKSAEAQRWFAVRPEAPANVATLPAANAH